jgi:hypothetical protein
VEVKTHLAERAGQVSQPHHGFHHSVWLVAPEHPQVLPQALHHLNQNQRIHYFASEQFFLALSFVQAAREHLLAKHHQVHHQKFHR